MRKYTATAVWDEHLWFVQCDQLPGATSTVSRLSDAVAHQREAIAFVADVTIDQVDVEVRYELPARSQISRAVKAAQARRAAAIAAADRASAASAVAAAALVDAGMSTRDAAKVLGVSQPRISQLTRKVSA